MSEPYITKEFEELRDEAIDIAEELIYVYHQFAFVESSDEKIKRLEEFILRWS